MDCKPAMAVGQTASAAANPPPPGSVLPGALPRGPQPPAVDHRKLGSKVDIRLSGPLRAALTDAAKAAGVTDGAFVRGLVADALGIQAEQDRVSGPRQRIPDADLVVLSGLIRDVGGLYAPVRTSKVEEVLAGLDGIRAALVPMVVGLNARGAA